MATESADGPEQDVSLPPPLAEWLDERAAALGVDRGEVLVQLVGAYRGAADLEDDAGIDLSMNGDMDDRIAEKVESHLDSTDPDEDIEALEGRLGTLESELENSVEDLRNRVLQLRDGIKDRAPRDHDHDELSSLAERVDGLAEDVEAVGTDVTETVERIEEFDERLSAIESKLDRLARVVVAIRKQTRGADSEREEFLDQIRLRANQQGITQARCAACNEFVQIPLLTEPACPHCGTETRDVKPPNSALGGALNIRHPKLTGIEPPALEGNDE